jgi:predicted RNA binding protein YcfA (HicA-like mRNA interferase family)
MEARQLLKQLKDDGWYLGDTEGASRQYVHPGRPGVITVCVRYTDQLGPETEVSATTPGESMSADHEIVVESTSTGASAYVTGLSGCVATGKDDEEVRERLLEALSLHRRALERAA